MSKIVTPSLRNYFTLPLGLVYQLSKWPPNLKLFPSIVTLNETFEAENENVENNPGSLFMKDLSRHVAKITGLDPDPDRRGKNEEITYYESSNSQSDDYATLVPNNMYLKDCVNR